mmetsp:Transcript_84646/g.273639  ORF Transcript_84646/g.273639 Transcript_84646/m.273639 type:complete len:249 (-) Transcript_84646:314-1060(-)
MLRALKSSHEFRSDLSTQLLMLSETEFERGRFRAPILGKGSPLIGSRRSRSPPPSSNLCCSSSATSEELLSCCPERFRQLPPCGPAKPQAASGEPDRLALLMPAGLLASDPPPSAPTGLTGLRPAGRSSFGCSPRPCNKDVTFFETFPLADGVATPAGGKACIATTSMSSHRVNTEDLPTSSGMGLGAHLPWPEVMPAFHAFEGFQGSPPPSPSEGEKAPCAGDAPPLRLGEAPGERLAEAECRCCRR